jgi:hypothetical protein
MTATHFIQYSKKQLFLALFFTLFTIIALGIDSVSFYENYFDGRNVTNILAIIYFLLMYFSSDLHLRKLMFTMVLLSYIGELIFCKLLGMYEYRTTAIPIYVPFGHAIVYASGYIFAHSFWAIKNEIQLRKIFAVGFLALFLSVGIFLNDWFTLAFGGFFFWLVKRKQWNNLYYFIALCVIFIELVGTHFRCWAWAPKTFGIIPAVNPPMGAVFFYAGGDVLLAKIVRLWDNKNLKRV